MGVTLVKIDISKGLVKTITKDGVTDEQQYSTNAALAKIAEYMDMDYEIVSAGADVYVLKKPEGRKFIHKGGIDERSNL